MRRNILFYALLIVCIMLGTSAYSQEKNIIVNGLKGPLMETLRYNRDLYGNIFGFAGQIQDPIIGYVKNQGITSWFKNDHSSQVLSLQNVYEDDGQVDMDDWWTPNYDGVMGYQSDMPTNIGEDCNLESDQLS